MAQTKRQRQRDIATSAIRATDKVGAAAPIKSAANHFEAHLGILLLHKHRVNLPRLAPPQAIATSKLVPVFGCESARFGIG